MAEIMELHERLLEDKVRSCELERAYAATHLARLSDRAVPESMETSSLHSDLKRIDSHICSIAYPILESAGARAPSRLRTTEGS